MEADGKLKKEIFISLSKYLSCWHWNLNSYMYSFHIKICQPGTTNIAILCAGVKMKLSNWNIVIMNVNVPVSFMKTKMTSQDYFQCLNTFNVNPVLQVVELQVK